MVVRRALGFRRSAHSALTRGASWVYSLRPLNADGSGTAYFVAWSYYAAKFLAEVSVVSVSGKADITVKTPISRGPALDILIDFCQGARQAIAAEEGQKG